MKISVIVPCYNVEEYIEKCLQSLANQTYKNLEVIVVNDGSTDATREIIGKFCEGRENFIVVDKQNGGLSSARNEGFKYATGELIGFVDSDDFVDTDMYEHLYNNMVKENADLSICGKYRYENGVATPMQKEGIYLSMTGKQALKTLLSGNPYQNEAWDKLYKRELFDTVRFPEGKQYEDSAIMYGIMFSCNKVVYDSTPKYYYLIRGNSITGTNFSPKRMDYFEAGKKCLDFVNEKCPDLADYAAFRYVSIGLFLARDIILSKSNEFDGYLKTILADVKKYAKIAQKSGLFTKKQKVQLALLGVNTSLYKMAVRLIGAK